MQNRPKHHLSHVDLQGRVNQLNSYIENTTNYQTCPFLIESLCPDQNFNTEWMVQLQDVYRTKQPKVSLIGNTHIIVGAARCGKLGYAYYRKEQENRDMKDSMRMIVIDCLYHTTPYSFVCQLVEQLAVCMDKNLTNKSKKKQKDGSVIEDTEALTRSMVMDSQIRLKQLDRHILAKSTMKVVLVIKNCDQLVEKKKQTILYNLLGWIKDDVQAQIGLVLITRRLDFLEKLEKRVKSRMNGKMVFLAGPRDQKIIKQAIIKRIRFATERTDDDNLKISVKKFMSLFQKSTLVDALIKKEQTVHSPKQMHFYLQIFRLIFALEFEEKDKFVMPQSVKEFDLLFEKGYEAAKAHLSPYVDRQKYIFQNMNFPEFITMCLIRKLLMDERSRITLKQIKKQLSHFKMSSYSGTGFSFDYPLKCFERALKNLKRIRVIDLTNQKDIDNAEIICFMDPDTIKQAIEERDDLPTFVKSMLN